MKNGGFTVLELIVVMLIIGILAGIAGISGKTWLDKYRVESQTKEMYVDLMNARALAMQRSRTHFVILAAAQYTIYEDRDPLNPASQDGDGAFQASDTLVLRKDLNGVYALTIPGAAGQINFDSRGLASAAPGPLGAQQTIRTTASFGSAYDCIVISTTRIRMGAWNGTTCAVQ